MFIPQRSFLYLLVILLLGSFLRFYLLDSLPAEVFGDIVENIEDVNLIRNGDWRLVYGHGGREGLFFYIAAVTSNFFGNTYLNLKIVTASFGSATIISTYFLAKTLTTRKAALISAYLVAVSKWPLIFSRIGFRAGLIPLFTSLCLYFLLQAYTTNKRTYYILTGIFLGLGLYVYTAFKFAVVSVLFVIIVMIAHKKTVNKIVAKNMFIGFAIFTLVAIPQIVDMTRHFDSYFAHAGSMLYKNEKIRQDWPQVLLVNVKNQAGMFHIKGDVVFRVNPSNEPQIDALSGFFLLAGIAYWFGRRKTIYSHILFIPFLLLQLPSILVLNKSIDIPSATRSIGIIPLVYIFIATGIVQTFHFIGKTDERKIIYAIVLGAILLTNSQSYFMRYSDGLPNHNVAFDRVIAQKIDSLPMSTKPYIVGCCWGDWGQPQPNGILYSLKTKRDVVLISETEDFCTLIESKKNIFAALPPTYDTTRLDRCLEKSALTPIQSKYGDTIYLEYEH